MVVVGQLVFREITERKLVEPKDGKGRKDWWGPDKVQSSWEYVVGWNGRLYQSERLGRT